jgi:mannose-1-phosphate guanylyltransferase/mannose-6-phosphate isomerase
MTSVDDDKPVTLRSDGALSARAGEGNVAAYPRIRGKSEGSALIVPVILVGGAGTRLWPASTESLPKPFLPLVAGKSTFAVTLERLADPALFAAPVILANREHGGLVGKALAAAGTGGDILLEPEGRDTAAAIAAAASFVAARDPGAMLLILPADHLIADVEAFRADVRAALPAAAAGRIVVFGIRPDRPATSYGYIKPGEALPGATAARAVAAFVEKPDAATAAGYLAEGYLWNSGNFMLSAATALAEFGRHAPEVLAAARAATETAATEGGTHRLGAEAFAKAPRISFDYAVMEKTGNAAVVATGFDWSDLGTWSSVWDAAGKDAAGNATVGDVVLVETKGTYVDTDRPLVGVLGVSDLVVVVSDNQVLIAPRERADEVKKLVKNLDFAKEREVAGRSYRPWGYYQSLDKGETHQVKRIVVKPGGRLSLQKHRHRAEHWTVVRGTAEVTVGDEVKILAENQSVYIPLGAVHRMANPGEVPMVLIEVQYGDYLGEDDIIRIEDDYKRS